MFDLEQALARVIETGGSDLHLKVPSRPIIRVHGQLEPIPDSEPLKPADTEEIFQKMLTEEQKLEEFARENEVDFSYAIPGLARFRVNAFMQRGSVSIVCRAIPVNIKTVEELMLPPVINDLADEERGIILLTGTTGSGKSTTLAAMIDRINTTARKHIVTIEDPVEFLHKDKLSIINQREVGEDTGSFKRALRRVLRQDPDVILVGEMRDEETVRTALSAAETGHLVLSTVHTVDAAETVNRIIDFFSEAEQRQARAMLGGTLKGVISQRLVPTPDGNGRVATCEVLRMTGRVRDMIMNPDETGKLPEVISEGAYYGMQTFDQALLGHVQKGLVSMEDALKAATHQHDFKLLVSSDGQRSTSVEEVFAETAPRPEPSYRVERRRPRTRKRSGTLPRSSSPRRRSTTRPAPAGGEGRAQPVGGAELRDARRQLAHRARARVVAAPATPARDVLEHDLDAVLGCLLSEAGTTPRSVSVRTPGRSERGTVIGKDRRKRSPRRRWSSRRDPDPLAGPHPPRRPRGDHERLAHPAGHLHPHGHVRRRDAPELEAVQQPERRGQVVEGAERLLVGVAEPEPAAALAQPDPHAHLGGVPRGGGAQDLRGYL